MSNQAHHTVSGEAHSHDDALRVLLGMTQERFQQHADDAGANRELLDIGVKGEIAQQIEDFMIDPFMAIYGTRLKVDEGMADLINNIVVGFLKSRRSLIASAVRSDVDDLHYCIALNEDNLENRCEILRFSANYKDLDFASKYPVHLQIVPQRLMGKVKSKGQIL